MEINQLMVTLSANRVPYINYSGKKGRSWSIKSVHAVLHQQFSAVTSNVLKMDWTASRNDNIGACGDQHQDYDAE